MSYFYTRNMINKIYTIKSFVCLGDTLAKCYECDYCRTHDNLQYHYDTLPEDINPLFTKLPIAVNLFYGDPTLQWENTLKILKRLEDRRHEGIVMIVTKGKLPKIPKMNLKLHIGISYGPDELSQSNLEYNLKEAYNSWYRYSIEYRPICNGLNDSEEVMNHLFIKASQYGAIPISYCGLQLPPFKLPEKYKPYDNRAFSGQKYISSEINSRIKKLSQGYNIPIFHKTSCMLSYVHGLSYDYNIHFLKPIGTECTDCLMKDKCSSIRFDKIPLPFEYDIVQSNDYLCSFVKNGLCKTPSEECLKMSGFFIKPDIQTITRGDVRIIKWLTGCMTINVPSLIETPHISDFWQIKK